MNKLPNKLTYRLHLYLKKSVIQNYGCDLPTQIKLNQNNSYQIPLKWPQVRSALRSTVATNL